MAAPIVPDVRRIAQYRPFERGGLDLKSVLCELVLALGAIGDGRIGSSFECKDYFKTLWGLEVEIDEIRPILEQLSQAVKVERLGNHFVLAPTVLEQLRDTSRTWDETEQNSLREWKRQVMTFSPSTSDDEMATLEGDLRTWLHGIISRHGAEAALMLYPEDERARRFFETVGAHGFDALPDRGPQWDSLRSQTLPLLIRSPTGDQRQFLAGLLNTSFYMTVLTIDPGARHLVEAQMQGQRLYLDTNFLYAVLAAAPPEEVGPTP